MLSHLTTSSVYFLYTDASKIDFDAPMLGIDAYHVKSGQKDEFEKVVDGMGGGTPTGGWYVTKKIPPLPRVMPTDPEELRMVVGGRERAERRLKEKNPEIFVVIEGLKDGERELGNELDSKVERYVEKVERGVYGKFLEGKRDEGLEDR